MGHLDMTGVDSGPTDPGHEARDCARRLIARMCPDAEEIELLLGLATPLPPAPLPPASGPPAGQRRLGEKCSHGHPRTPENTRISPRGRVTCRICEREARRRRDAARRQEAGSGALA